MTIPSEAMELLYTAGGDVKSYKDFGIQFSGLEKKKPHTYHMVPVIPLLSIYPRVKKICVHTKTHTQMLLAASLVKAKSCKQPTCPSTQELLWPESCLHQIHVLKS